MKKHSSLELLFETTLRHLYRAEEHNFDYLKVLVDQTTNSELKSILKKHRAETQNQIERLEEIFTNLNIDIGSTKLQGLPGITDKGKELLKSMIDMNFTDQSKGMNGIISEAKELLRHFKDDIDTNNIALLVAALKIEHFEIACYEGVCDIAEILKEDAVLELLTLSLDEEMRMELEISNFASSKC